MRQSIRSCRGALVTAVAFVAYGRWALLRVTSGWWRWRDDAVITLSHARGLVAYGYPAVSAAAERVEGTSAPLQMFAAAIFYRLGGHGWAGFLDVQVLVGLALTGWFVARLLGYVFPAALWWAVTACSMVVAVVGLSTWHVLGWFGSGMENSLTVPLLVAVAATATGVLCDDEHLGWACGAALGLAGVVRVEFAVLMFPVLVVVVAMLWRQRRRAAYRVAGVSLGCWMLLHGWRWMTFHTLVPNTALAQNKHSVELGNVFWIGVVGIAAVVVMLVWRRPRWRVLTATAIGAASAAMTIGALATSKPNFVAEMPTALVVGLAGLWTVAAVAWIAGIGTPQVWAPLMTVGSVPIVQELLLGPARLDTTRIGAQSLPVLAVVLGIAVLGTGSRLPGLFRLATSAERRRTLRRCTIAIALLAVAAIGVQGLSTAAADSKPYNLCCEITTFTDVLAKSADNTAKVGLPRSITAVPDLGKFSFDGSDIIVDLGKLGDPMLTQIQHRRPDLVNAYLDQVQPPDLIEMHAMWECNTFRSWIESASFHARYDADPPMPKPDHGKDCPYNGTPRYFTRSVRDPLYRAEVHLAADLAAHPEDAAALVQSALGECTGSTSVLACERVRRAVARNLPELRTAGTLDAVVRLLVDKCPMGRVDRLLLTTPPGWAATAAPMLITALDQSDGIEDAGRLSRPTVLT